MGWLDQISVGKQPGPRRILLYGTDGIGKSTFGSMAPRPIFIPTERGTADIDCARFPLCQSYSQFMEYGMELYSHQHDYLTAVVDTADWLERLIHSDVCQKRGVESLADIGYGKGFDFAMTQWSEVLACLDALNTQKGMTIILLAHTEICKFENPAGPSYDRYWPALDKRARDLLKEWCDEVFFANYKTYTATNDEGFGRKKAVGISSNNESGLPERIIHTVERPSHVAKNRLNLPEELPLDWNAFAPFLSQAA